MNRRPRIVVIGGGMAGLGAAWELEKARRDGAAVDWMLFETDHRLGGKVLTERTDDGFVIEGGPDSFIVDKPWPMELARELGIGDRLLDSNETVRRSWVLSGGRLHELPEGLILMVPTRLLPFALSGLISWRGKLRMGMDLVLPRGKAIGDESLGDFVRRRLGREALAKVAEPLVAGIHAGDPEQMSLRATFPMFHEMEEKHRSLIVGMVKRRWARRAAPGAQARGAAAGGGGAAAAPRRRAYFLSFAGGLADLSDAVVAALPLERLRTGVAVTALEPLSGGSVDGPRYRLRLDGGGEEAADAVVLATPAFAAGDLLRTVAPAASAGLGSIPYVSTATVSLAFERGKVRWPLQGFGFVVPRAEERGIMAATFSSSKFDGRAPADGVLWRAFVGRAGREEALSLDDAGLVALVRRELRDILDLDAEPLFARVFRWPRGMPQYRVGHGTLIDRVERDVAVAPGVEVAGGYVHGIGIGDCLREGRAAAQRALAHVADVVEPPPPAQPVDVPAGDGITD